METSWLVISLTAILVVAAPAYAADECNADADCKDTTMICTGASGSKTCRPRAPTCDPACTAPTICGYKAGGVSCEAPTGSGRESCTAGVCMNGGSCPSSGVIPCICADGFVGDKCETAPLCTPACNSPEICVYRSSGNICQAQAAIGWEYCTGDVCKNGGICSASGITPCICKDGFVGDKCETKESMSHGNNDSPTSKLLLMTKLFNLTMSFP